jgi:hypothetical protein
MMFAQVYPTFDRFYAKTFLTDALQFFGGAAKTCMVDNTSVIVAHGTGRNAVIAPEMVAFGDRFGFSFVAHEKGDANRSARVERPFHFIENNFYPGRTFSDPADVNAQLKTWCVKKNQTHKRALHAAPTDLFATERLHLQPLPSYIPEVVRIVTRRVDVEGYVTLHTNRYSVPDSLIDLGVELHETLTEVRVFHRHKVVAVHRAAEPGGDGRSTLPAHRRRKPRAMEPPSSEEQTLLSAGPEFVAMIAALRQHRSGYLRPAIRHLYRMFLDYPTEPLRTALATAVAHGLYDVDRIERMVLRCLAGEVFQLSIPPEEE